MRAVITRFIGVPRLAGANAGVRRWVIRGVTALGIVAALFGLAVLALVHSLDQPWVKRRLQAIVHDAAGVDVDYRAVHVGLVAGRIAIDDAVVRSPPEVRAVAPDLLRVGRVEALWSWRSLLFGGAPPVERVSIADVLLTVAVDENGRTSFDALAPPGPTPPRQATPLSGETSILRAAPPFSSVEVDRVAAVLVRTDHGVESERTDLHGVDLGLGSMFDGARGWQVSAHLGSRTAPLDLAVTRRRAGAAAGEARAKLWLEAAATAADARVALDVRLLEQTFAPDIAVDHSLHAEADARFEPTKGQTEITLHDVQAGEGTATAEASIALFDAGGALVRHGQGDVDVARLLQWLPPGLVPVTLGRAHLVYRVDSLTVGPVLRLADGGSVAADVEIADAKSNAGGAPLVVGGGTLSVHAQPANGNAIALRASLNLANVQRGDASSGVAADAVAVDLDAIQGEGGAVDGRVAMNVTRASLDGGSTLALPAGALEVRVGALHLDTEQPLATRGDVTVSLSAPSFAARAGTMRTAGDDVKFDAHATLSGHAPYALAADVALARLRVAGRDGATLVDAPVHVHLGLEDATPDLARPASSRGVVHLKVDVADLDAAVDVTRRDAVDFALRVAAPTLKTVRPWVASSASVASAVPWDQLGVAVRSNGRVTRLDEGSPSLDETTEIDVDRPAFEGVAAKSLALKVHSSGDAIRHRADVDLRFQGLAIAGAAPSDDHVTLSATVDRARRSLGVELGTEGRAASNVSLSATFDRVRASIPYSAEVHLKGLAPLAPLLSKVHGLEGFDVSQLTFDLSSQGSVRGVVRDVGSDGTLVLEPHPTRTAGVEGKLSLHATNVRWSHGDDGIIAPSIAWDGDLHSAGARRTVDSHLGIDSLHLDLGQNNVDLTGVHDDSSIAVEGDLADPTGEVTQHTTIHAAQQDFVPEYAVGDVDFALGAQREANGLVHVTDLKLKNGAAGTALGLNGNLELGSGRHTLSIASTLEQDLSRLTRAPERLKGRGTLSLEANVVSPDLSLLRVRAALKAHGVTVSVPRAGVELDEFNGEIPVAVTLEAGKNGVSLSSKETTSPYSMLRFADQHPLLSHSGFVSIRSFKSPFATIAPLVGNLAVEQRVISLRQFEMGVRGGTITGQCGLDWEGPKSTLELHVRATGVQSSHGEPFDGNIAVVVAAADRTVEGRAEILRIGERHLLDLLDLEDPTHVDPAMNRVRSALLFGYPDKLRLVFNHGFASAHIELGGLARLVSISEIRGIPMGPIVDRFLAPVFDTEGGP